MNTVATLTKGQREYSALLIVWLAAPKVDIGWKFFFFLNDIEWKLGNSGSVKTEKGARNLKMKLYLNLLYNAHYSSFRIVTRRLISGHLRWLFLWQFALFVGAWRNTRDAVMAGPVALPGERSLDYPQWVL
jgi:hypothetical protein